MYTTTFYQIDNIKKYLISKFSIIIISSTYYVFCRRKYSWINPKLFNSYLNSRKQYVKIYTAVSEEANIKLGVPQGSILGRGLFILYLNDMPTVVKDISQPSSFSTTIHSYSGDTEIYTSGKLSELPAVSHQNWLPENELKANPTKFKYTLIGTPTMLGEPQDPVIVWNTQAAQFQKKTWANELALRRKLYSLQLKENQSVQQHIKEMKAVFEKLSIVGDPIKEEDRVVHLLASLPPSFDLLVAALEASEDVPKMEMVTERLLHEEIRQKEKGAWDIPCQV